ncbi:MAG: V4R domain-containing protein [Candidatus Hydrothermarchaeaceae archaeon]
MKSDAFVIYASKHGAKTIKNPVRIEIMRSLSGGERTFDELVCLVGKAKSTVSVHLERLEKDRLISSKVHPKDKRKKIFFLTSQAVGASDVPMYDLGQSVRSRLRKSAQNPSEFSHELFRTILYSLESCGINTHPALRTAGRRIGMEISSLFKADDIEGLFKEISNFWHVHGIGKVRVLKMDPEIEISSENCFYCKNMPNVGRTLCALDEGMIEAIINSRLGVKSCVKEVECSGLGHNRCKFTIRLED